MKIQRTARKRTVRMMQQSQKQTILLQESLEGLRLFGYPEWCEIYAKSSEAFDLLGNTVAVPVVEHVVCTLMRRSNEDQT